MAERAADAWWEILKEFCVRKNPEQEHLQAAGEEPAKGCSGLEWELQSPPGQ